MIGSLLYLTTCHLDISFSVGACARYHANPKESHLTTIKRIRCYVNGTLNYGSWYPYDSYLVVARYSNTDWVGNVEDRKNTFDVCFFIGDCLVAWLSKKQNFISLSTVEAEYIASRSCCMQLLWMKQMIKTEIEQGTMNIHHYNSSAINISENLVFHSHTKHIEICYHFIRDFLN